MFQSKSCKIFVSLILVFLLTPMQLYAYLDPATGSMIIQTLIALGIGAMVGIKVFWTHLTTFYHKLFSKKTASPEGEKET